MWTMNECTLSQLAERLGAQLCGPADRVVRGCGSLHSAAGDEVTFLANRRYERLMAECGAAAVIVSPDYDGPGESLLRCEDPYFAFREAMVLFYGFREPPFTGVSERAEIDPSAEIGGGAAVGPFVTVCRDVTIGPRAVLYPGVFIGPGCKIGSDCLLYPNVTIYDGCVLGERVTIHAGSSVGHDGFGYATHAGRHEKIPTPGIVELGDDVEIGACCAIDRATLGATVIGEGTKFSNLVAIGHGTQLGRGCLMVAQSGIAGSVTVGNYCAFAGQSGSVGHIRIGDGVRVAAQAGLTNDVPDGGEYAGSPAFELAKMRRTWATFPRLPQMRSETLRLRKELDALRAELDALKAERNVGEAGQ
jgi:UDP-3-O-[3-hydroxymyristoyl] glucosamine N-acyltransferase